MLEELNSTVFAAFLHTQALFIVWTEKETFSEFVKFDKRLWQNVQANLEVFFKSYVIPALLLLKPIILCGKCVFLEEQEIELSHKYFEICVSRPYHDITE